MPSLQIYDTKGNEYSPSGETGRTNDRVKELFYAGVRFAVESVGKTRVTAFFRARETRDARSEQFYAEYTTRDPANLIGDFNSELTQRVESEWGYTIDDSSEEMSVFRAIKQNAASVPGSDRDRRILSEMIGSGSIVNVGVRDATDAVGLVREMANAYSRAAITDSANTDSLSNFDLAIVTGSHTGIEPLGATEQRWTQTEESLRRQFIDEEVGRIEDAVHALSRDHGLSSSEIRDRVTRRVPALKAPTSGSSGLAASAGGGDDHLIPAEVGKYVAIGAVALLILIGGVFGAGMLGLGPLAGGSGDAIQGTVYADANETEPVQGATVLLYNGSTDGEPIEETNTSDGTYAFTGVNATNHTVRVQHEEYEYEDKAEITPEDSPVDFTPAEAGSSGGTVSGEIVAADTGEPVESAAVTLRDDADEAIDSSEGATFEFAVDDADATYSLEVSADGYANTTETVTASGDGVQIELEGGTVSLSGTVTDSGSDDPIEATLTVRTEGETFEATADPDDGSYELSGLPEGEHSVNVTADGYDPVSETVTVEGDSSQNFELTELASYNGTVVNTDGDGVNDANVTLSNSEGRAIESIASKPLNPNKGSFDFGELPAGTYTVTVEKETYETYTNTFELEPGDTRTDEIELILE